MSLSAARELLQRIRLKNRMEEGRQNFILSFWFQLKKIGYGQALKTFIKNFITYYTI